MSGSVSESLRVYMKQVDEIGTKHKGHALLQVSFKRILQHADPDKQESFKQLIQLLTMFSTDSFTKELMYSLAVVVLPPSNQVIYPDITSHCGKYVVGYVSLWFSDIC